MMLVQGRKPLVPGVRRDKLPPSQRGGGTVAVTADDMARLKRLAGEVPVKSFVTVVLDRFESRVPSVPVSDLQPVSQAIHDLDRQVAQGRNLTQEGLLRAVRAIRDLLDGVLNR